MFAAMGGQEDSVLDAVGRASEAWTARMIEAGKYLGWIAWEDRKAVASAGMMILDWPPHPLDPMGQNRAYLLNVYVDPEFRRRGLARELVSLCLEEARRRKIKVIALHASRQGASLYESLGFRTSNEMLYAAGD